MAKESVQLDAAVFERFTFMRYYGLSVSNINDTLYNIVVESWREVVEKHYSTDTSREEKLASIKKIFLGGKLIEFLRNATKFLFEHVMHIPKGMTLPQDLDNLSCPKGTAERELKARIARLEEEIVSLRDELKKAVYENNTFKKGIEVLQLSRRPLED